MRIEWWKLNKDWERSQSLLDNQFGEKLAVRPMAAFGAFVQNVCGAEFGT
jgi:hypothetical protein